MKAKKLPERKRWLIRKSLGIKKGRELESGEFLKAVRASEMYLRLRSETNDAFFPLYFDKKRYLVLLGGGGSGKSIFAGRKVLERVYREREHTVLVLRKVAKTLRESCFRQLVSQIREHYNLREWNISKTDMSIVSPNGSRIIFAGLDDVEKLKSIYGITMVWIEEASEISESDFNQIDIRLRGKSENYHQMILTFNPVSVSHWLKSRFFDKTDPGATVMKSTYHDNRFLDDSAKEVLEGFKETDEYYYNVYCLGNWGISGQSVFGSGKVYERLENVSEPMKVGEFYTVGQSVNFTEYSFGPISIYEEPVIGHTYVLGGDTAGEGEDYFISQVISVRTGRQVAVLRMQEDEDRYVLQSVLLCRYYNNALLAFECNFSTYPVREALRLGYDNQYLRRTEDTIARNFSPSYGFRTTSVTRPLILSTLIRIFRESPELFTDRATLDEMLSFVRTPFGRMEAERGCHDDMIMALAIAHYVRLDLPPEFIKEPDIPRKVNFAFEREDDEGMRVV